MKALIGEEEEQDGEDKNDVICVSSSSFNICFIVNDNKISCIYF